MKKAVYIYTDGACSGNQEENNIGGWGAILEYGKNQKELYGGEIDTTNNRMEMQALLSAFDALKKDGQIINVFSDSAYLVNCFKEKWYENWYKNNWRNSKKNDVENRDIWEKLLPFLKEHRIQFYKVKGHINLDSKSTNLNKHYEKFVELNGRQFSFENFKYITKMNNRADELANQGINEIREHQLP